MGSFTEPMVLINNYNNGAYLNLVIAKIKNGATPGQKGITPQPQFCTSCLIFGV